MSRATAFLLALIAAATFPACGRGPASPGPAVSIALPAQVTSTIVSCTECQTGPAIWAVAEADTVIVNRTNQPLDVATVEARAFNATRNTPIASNTRPNVDHTYSNTSVAPNGTLTLRAGVVYFPLPPPRDDVRLIVVVTFRDGRSVRAESLLITP